MSTPVQKRRQPRGPRISTPPEGAYKTVWYEIQAMRAYADELTSPQESNPAIKNALLEAFLLHVRNLRDFFQGTSSPDDILAKDFDQTFTAPQFTELDKRHDELNKLLAHPSYLRDSLNPNWQVSDLRSELDHAWEDFLQKLAVSQPSHHQEFQRYRP